MDEDQSAGAGIVAALTALRESFDAKIRYDEAKERQIAALHEELQEYRRGMYQQIMRPVLTDLVGIYDEIAGEGNPGKSPLLDLVQETLLRYGVTAFTCEGEHIDRSRQQVIDVETTGDPELDRQVARRLRPGFELDGRILRPEWIAAYRYADGLADPWRMSGGR
jgi:molecular chaperone GrpE (heat shock protein)